MILRDEAEPALDEGVKDDGCSVTPRIAMIQ